MSLKFFESLSGVQHGGRQLIVALSTLSPVLVITAISVIRCLVCGLIILSWRKAPVVKVKVKVNRLNTNTG